MIRPAILWNDGRTTEECDYLNNVIGKDKLLSLIHICGTLSIKYSNPLSFQSLGKGAFGTVGAGDTKTGIQMCIRDRCCSC